MTFRAPSFDLDLASSCFPGGTLFNAIYDREFMRLSDRGGASGLIGTRWADLCARALDEAPHTITRLDAGAPPLEVDRVIRLDDVPAVAAQASRLKLQNPDFLLIREGEEGQHMLAADAKFSVETAKSRQVSPEVLTSLIAMGPAIGNLISGLRPDVTIENGIFLCPDYSLTRRLLKTRRGFQRVTVTDDEIRLIPVDADAFLETLGHDGLIDFLASLDHLPLDHHRSLALTLYYFRLARVIIGCWLDRTNPLLPFMDVPVIDLAGIEEEVRRDAMTERDAWRLALRWNDLAEHRRRQRGSIDQVTALPLSGKDLRGRIQVAANAAGIEPPSTNRVRRVLGAWYRKQYRNEFGPIPPPVDDFDLLVTKLSHFGRSLRAQLEQEADDVILDFVSAPVNPGETTLAPICR